MFSEISNQYSDDSGLATALLSIAQWYRIYAEFFIENILSANLITNIFWRILIVI